MKRLPWVLTGMYPGLRRMRIWYPRTCLSKYNEEGWIDRKKHLKYVIPLVVLLPIHKKVFDMLCIKNEQPNTEKRKSSDHFSISRDSLSHSHAVAWSTRYVGSLILHENEPTWPANPSWWLAPRDATDNSIAFIVCTEIGK